MCACARGRVQARVRVHARVRVRVCACAYVRAAFVHTCMRALVRVGVEVTVKSHLHIAFMFILHFSSPIHIVGKKTRVSNFSTLKNKLILWLIMMMMVFIIIH